MTRTNYDLNQIKADLERSKFKLQQIQTDLERSDFQPPQHQIKKDIEIEEYILQGQIDYQKLLTVLDDLVKQNLTDKAEGILSKILKQNNSNGEKLIEVLIGKGDWQTLWLMAQAAKKIGKINLVDKACAAVQSINPQFWFAREYPTHARGYYSQCEQDKVIEQFFLDYPPKNKIFVEVGACDGVHYSNVRRLYETYGWTGLCIEPVKRNFEKLAQSYQNTSVKCIRAAVGLEEGELDINVGINPDIPEWQSDVSTFLESETLRWQEEYGMLWEKEKVSIQRLTTILDKNGIPEIDFISIDTEGFDFDVLKSLDFSRFHPSMIVVEYGKDRQQIISYLAELGYSLLFDNGQDLFMVRLNHLFSEICPYLPATKAYTGATGNPPYAEIQQATENHLHEFIGKSANEVQCIVIVGGHLGFEIDRFLQNYSNAEIHVFEASQRYFSLLLERFAGSPRVFCHNYAVSEENGTAVFYETTLDGTGSLLPMKIQEDQDQGLTTFGASPAEAYTVATVTLDSFAPLAGKQIDLLWCDVQGAELKVLKGAKQTLERCSSLFLEVWLYRTMYQDQCQLSNLEKYLADHSIYLSGIGLNQSGGGEGNSFWLKGNQIHQKEILTVLNSKKKIVALIETKNESIQIAFCIRAVAKFVDAICVHDDVSDDNTVEIVESLRKEYPIERIIRKTESWQYSETGRQKPLLDAGREIGGTHFIFIDADEAFTSNLVENDFLRKEILKLNPGDRLQLAWIQLWRSVKQYRYDTSVWTNNYKQIIFADDGKCYYGDAAFHVGKMPLGLEGNLYTIEGYNYGLLHFQFVNWRNLLVKQAWYRCLEHIRQPQKSIQEINSTYGLSKDETNLGLRPCPNEWLSGYPFFDERIYKFPEQWREKQVLQWFKEYGYDYFSELDIWDIDWGNGIAELLPTPLSSFRDRKYHPSVTNSEFKDGCKILFYYAGFTNTSHIADGGAATAIISLATSLSKSYSYLSVEITGDHITKSHTYNGVKFLAFPQHEDREAFISKYDVVIFGAVIRTLLNIPKRSGQIWIFHHHCWYFEAEDTNRFNDLDAILCLSEIHRDAAISQGVPPEKTKICTNMVGDIFTPQPVARKKHSILFAGAIVSDKGLHVLLEALPIVKGIFPDAEVHVYGSAALWLDHSDSYEKDIKSVERNGVYFHGSVPRNRMPEIYSRYSILCLPSYLESFSLVSVEAQACGCIPVVHHVGGVAATLIDGKTGFLYSPNTEQELAKTIIKAFEKIDSDDSIRQVSATFAQESFSSYKIVEQLVSVLRTNLEDHQYSPVTFSRTSFPNTHYDRPHFKVSAIVSTYKSEKFMRGCLQDLVEQTLYQKGEVEIIVIDSASPENEQAIVREFQSKYPNIVYERTTEREPLYPSWNRAIKMLRGVYITNANADDRHRPDALEILANYLDTHLDTSLVYADQLISTVANETWLTNQATQRFSWPDFDYSELERQCICGPQPMWRKDIHNRHGYFRTDLIAAADYEFWLRIGKNEKLVHIPETLGIYYHNPDGLSTSGNAPVDEPIQIWAEYGISREGVSPVNVVVPISPSELNALPYRKIGQSTVNRSRPLVSVIIPTKDRPEMLAQAIQSVLNQTFTELEIIVVNDGGVDVQSVISRLNTRGNIVYKKHDRALERSAARNTGIRAARGKYIAYLDDDDNYYPNHIETLVKFLENSEYKIAYTDAVMAEQKKENGEYVTLHRSVPYSLDFDKDKILVSNCTPNLCLMHEKSCLDEVGLFDETLSTHEDWDLIIRLSRKFDIAISKKLPANLPKEMMALTPVAITALILLALGRLFLTNIASMQRLTPLF
ncbi:FkbM family methyltransferase [Tychonema bourrellyi FEM_GT703]|uniref:FkbM family methyltransferase n=1 Tax=Tychonema bourrellyi FEM_GT703 TaxID=2040638 RepID=A0A2G4F6M3_9CYAN|nr:FkbM family methyltransferase [Tychonema bourrellyi]PHX57422.1 FkbM family methyltransferase [Tychonema bourrellyi FEM_GT703]